MKNITKTCIHHGVLSLEQISKNGKYLRCKLCKKEADYKFAAKNPGRMLYHQNRSYLKLKYNITKEDYEVMFSMQNGLCAICNKPESQRSRRPKVIPSHPTGIQRLSIDHDHVTGKIRQLLCRKCNLMLGSANDSIKILEQAISYLKKHEIST